MSLAIVGWKERTLFEDVHASAIHFFHAPEAFLACDIIRTADLTLVPHIECDNDLFHEVIIGVLGRDFVGSRDFM